jgi:predicted nucleic acid-binding protein
MIFIDANIFLAYANASDAHHKRAARLLGEFEENDAACFTSDYVFNEVIGVTGRKQGKNEAIALGNHLFKSVFVLNIDDHVLQKAWALYYKTKLGLNLVDCTNVVAAQLAGATGIATFDKEFKNIPGLKVIA